MKRAFLKAALYVWHAVVCLVVLGLFFTIFWAVSRAVSVHRERKAETFLKELRTLRPGAIEQQKFDLIQKRFGLVKRCKADLCSYEFRTGFAYPISTLWERTEWDYLGIRPWRLIAEIEVRNNDFSRIEWLASVGRGRGFLHNEGLLSGNMWAWLDVHSTISSESFDREAYFLQVPVDKNSVLVTKPNLTVPGGGQGLNVSLSPSAPPEARAVAFDVNLHCATAISACTQLCQLAPSAWRSYVSLNHWTNEMEACEPR